MEKFLKTNRGDNTHTHLKREREREREMLSSSSYSHRARVYHPPHPHHHKKQKSVVASKNAFHRGVAVTAMGSGGIPAKDRKLRWSSDVDQWEKPDFTSATDCIALNRSECLTVSVPATTANIGPGFDSLGFAVDLRNDLTVEFSPTGKFVLELKGEGCDFLPRDETNAVIEAVKKGYRFQSNETRELDVSALKFTSTNRIPPARGLGSSSAALVCGLAAGMTLAGSDVSTARARRDLLNLACEVEGHPDNVAPAIFGGFQIALSDENEWITSSVNIPEGMLCSLFIPDFHSLTSETRAALSDKLTQAEAVFNIGRTATLINAFNQSDFRLMKIGTQDIMHQHQRGDKQFGLDKIIAAAIGAGAHCCFLSGAGPTVLAMTGGDENGKIGDSTIAAITAERVAEAMSDAAKEFGVEGQALIVEPTMEGISAWIDVFDDGEDVVDMM